MPEATHIPNFYILYTYINTYIHIYISLYFGNQSYRPLCFCPPVAFAVALRQASQPESNEMLFVGHEVATAGGPR